MSSTVQPSFPSDVRPDVEAVVQAAFHDTELGLTLAMLVLHRGAVVAETYGTNPDGSAVTAETTLISWSMAKSVTHALIGCLVDDGLLRVDQPAPVPKWAGDPRSRITIQQLLTMSSGLKFVEDYVDAGISDCIEMLFGSGASDVASYASDQPLIHEPGSFWSYASGTTNILCRIAGDLRGGGSDRMRAYLTERLFRPLEMGSAALRFDEAGTFIGSSFLYATAREFAAFGELYRNRGVAPTGQRLLTEAWVAHAQVLVPESVTDDPTSHPYGAHWWLWPEYGGFAAHGYEGQRILVVPDRELTIVRLGKTPETAGPSMETYLRQIVERF